MKVGIITLGCDKNTVDNEYLAGVLEEHGCEVMPVEMEGPWPTLDAAVVTTCGFIEAAKQQSIETILALLEAKRRAGNPSRVYVAGCLAQRYHRALTEEIADIDGMVGVGQYHDLVSLILDNEPERAGSRNRVRPKPVSAMYTPLRRRRLHAAPYAYVKVSDGCNHACSFCSIPLMKGKLSSVPADILVEETRRLVNEGVREINLIAQDLADYGRDLQEKEALPRLLERLSSVPGDFWIRCLYLYPGGISEGLLRVFRECPKILPYIDMPLQHLDAGVLRSMKRPWRSVHVETLIERMRENIPGLVLRTTMIVGFPGETEEAYTTMLEKMRSLRFERLGAFMYSREEGTPAALMPKQVHAATKQRRWRTVMDLQREITREIHLRRLHQHECVLVEGYDAASQQGWGRSYWDAPEVDGTVYFRSPEPVAVGSFVNVVIENVEDYDAYGVATSYTGSAAQAG